MRHPWLKTPRFLRDEPEWLGRALLILLSLMLIWGSIIWNLTQGHREIEAEARTDASNLARTFEENLLRSVESGWRAKSASAFRWLCCWSAWC